MKKKIGVVFIILCFALCLIPFAGMTFFATNTTTENKELSAFPEIYTEDGLNVNFLEDLGAYFEDHFAFREYLVNADALIQSRIFHVSNVDTVLTGEDGWLYYSATLDNYLGSDLMSERRIYSAAHNLALMEDYVSGQGARFEVAIAPNKNSLYGEHMPYYDSYRVSSEKDASHLLEELDRQEVTNVNLFSLFKDQGEILYLKRDSHWNGKGAVMVYNELLNNLEVSHDYLDTVPVTRTKTEVGDLNTMIYPLTAEPEWNYYYELNEKYQYVTDTESVEDNWIETENPDAESSILMFRDSFGNSLLPLFANSFQHGYFSKGIPYRLQTYMETDEPDIVIIELVERNLSQLVTEPPLMQPLESDPGEEAGKLADASEPTGTATCAAEEAEADVSYIAISGTVENDGMTTGTNVYVSLSAGDVVKTFPAFLTVTEGGSDGYKLYLTKEYMQDTWPDELQKMQVEILTESDEDWVAAARETIDFSVWMEE